MSRRVHAGSIKLSGTRACGKAGEKRRFCRVIGLWATINRTNVQKWEMAPTVVIKLLAITVLSVYFFEENNFVAFTMLSRCSENEKPLTPAKLSAYSGARW